MKPTTLIYPITAGVYQRITKNWESLRDQARGRGIELMRDGTFSGKATGRVAIEQGRISVTITDKPWIIPIGAIDAELKRLFS